MKRSCSRPGLLLAGLVLGATCFAQQAATPYQEGIRLLRNQDWGAAAAALEQAVKLQPKTARVHIALGIARLRSGSVQAGLASFRRAVELNPSSADAHYNLGLALRESGQAEPGRAEFANAVKINPGHEDARLALGLAYQQAGESDQAWAQYTAVLRKNPRSAEAHNWLGVIRLQKNQFLEAVAAFRKAVAAKPDFIRAWNNLGSALAQAGDVEDSITAFKKAVALDLDRNDGKDPQLRMNLGIALRGKGDAGAALEEFRAVLRSRPDHAEVHQQLGLTLKQLGHLEEAADAFESVLRLDSEHREAFYNLGTVLRQQAASLRRSRPARSLDPSIGARLREAAELLSRGDRSAARTLLERLAQDAPPSALADIVNLLGFVQGQERDLAAAVATLKRAVELAPEMPEAHYNRGVALWYSGDHAAALESLERSIRLNPAAGDVYSFLGMARKEMGELDRARQVLHRAIALSPNLPAPYVDLGLVFLRSGQVEKGIGQIEAAINLPAPAGPIPDLAAVVSELRSVAAAKPDLAEVHNVLGLLLGKQGADPKQVAAEFREAVRLRAGYAEAHNNLGLVLMQAGDNEKGIAEFREALRHAPEYAGALGNLGAALVAPQPLEAIRLLEKAVAIQPTLVRAHYNLALAYAQSPPHAEMAMVQFPKVIAMEPRFAAPYFEFGKFLLRRRDSLPKAITHFREAVKLDPKLGAARYQLGLALTRAGERAEGAAELDKARVAIEEERKLETSGQLMGEARAALEGGRNDSAIATLQQLVRLLPSSPEAHHQLGLALLAKGDRGGAAASFEKALELDPRYAPARESLQRGVAAIGSPALAMAAPDDPEKVRLIEDYIRRQQLKEVEPLIVDYLKAYPNSWWGHYVHGYALFGQRRIGDSIAALAMSLRLNIANADAHRLLGRNLMLIGRFDAARTELEQAVKLKPQSAELRYDLGKIYSAHDNYPDAKRELEAAIRLDPSYMEAYDALGLVMEALGEDAAALGHYRKSAEINEARRAGFSSPYINLAAYYNRIGNSNTALENARKALEMNPKSDAGNFQFGKALDRLQQWPEAAEALNKAVEANPRASSYHYVLAGVYRHLGKLKESQEQMEIFRGLEKEAAEFEQKRREARREESRPGNRLPR